MRTIGKRLELSNIATPFRGLPDASEAEKNSQKNQQSTEKLLLDRIEDLLPQTQCGKCGYAGCRPYAEAMAKGEAINQCPPGGEKTILRLANLLNVSPLPLNEQHGEPTPPRLAFIREDECIGCTKCIKACPVDAILGAAKFMHTVIEAECTGCDLCVEPCPVDCIDMLPAIQISDGFIAEAATAARYKARFETHQLRLATDKINREEKRQARLKGWGKNQSSKASFSAGDAKLEIQAAVARVRSKRLKLKNQQDDQSGNP